jgi:uncharacterized protein (TIGR03083 family)
MADDPWPTIHAERTALAADLDGLDEGRWTTPSLCQGWSVLDVTGHMVATAKMTPAGFFGSMLGAGFNFTKMANKHIAAETADGAAATVGELRAVAGSRKHPP